MKLLKKEYFKPKIKSMIENDLFHLILAGCSNMHLQHSYFGGRISEQSGFNTSWG